MKEGEQQASCLVAKQAVEFPQVYTTSIPTNDENDEDRMTRMTRTV